MKRYRAKGINWCVDADDVAIERELPDEDVVEAESEDDVIEKLSDKHEYLITSVDHIEEEFSNSSTNAKWF